MAKEARKLSRRQEMANEGTINAQYTQNAWFVKVKPAFSIHKILIDFVEKGKKGSGFGIYVDLDLFDNWMDDVLSRTFARMLRAELEAGEKYPKYYKYVTGENGEKSVGFANSTGKSGGYVINGSTVVNGSRVFANVPVDYNWLSTTAKYYKACVKEAQVFETMARTIVEASQKYHQEAPDDQMDGGIPTQTASAGSSKNVYTTNKAPAATQQPAPAASAKSASAVVKGYDGTGALPAASAPVQEAPQQPAPEASQSAKVASEKTVRAQVVSTRLQVTTPLTDMKNGGKALKAKDKDGKEFAVVFSAESKSKPGWSEFEAFAKESGAVIGITGAIRDNTFFVHSFAS